MDAVQKLEAIKLALVKVRSEEASLLANDGLADDGSTMSTIGVSSAVKVGVGLASLAGSVVLGYHGYKRNNDSIAWGLGWWFLGGAFPVGTAIGAFLAYDKGFAKPIRKTVETKV